ncbi:hypothetical protein N7457_004011 [Penicillium paradoxum]|uniref:uncharacterized protein n=1 Tax=Penicillium paradoxum TaxID=176176 RepID=UPI002546B04C|nr:uncharacterized protein N7457_004011 [Penicillium paradoxum]KAJ5782237.1 hypothetical protein N7457_004011 [Penicillium paradoxum]
MGYTHYYTIVGWDTPEWQRAWVQLIEAVRKIIEEAKIPLSGPTQYDGKITSVVANCDDGIYLNGIGEHAHEPFVLCEPGAWAFCKTARKPYDDVVSSILLRAWMLAPKNVDIGTDGEYDDWARARELCETLWPDESTEGFWVKLN